MTAIEITLIIVGTVFIVSSFLVQEKLSKKDIERITQMSEAELQVIVENQLKNADSQISDAIEENIGNHMEFSKRSMEKTTNEKIMAINEYSDTVLESMNKTHNEIMFLYSMLNDKHKELTELAGELGELQDEIREQESDTIRRFQSEIASVEQRVEAAEPMPEQELLAASTGTHPVSAERNHNEDILFLHSAGKSDVDIAKDLGLGLGEVKLVIGLFKEGENSEI